MEKRYKGRKRLHKKSKKGTQVKLSIPRGVSTWLGKTTFVKIHTEIPIYLLSINGSPSLALGLTMAGNSTLDISSLIFNTHKYFEMDNSWGLFRIHGVAVVYERMNVEGGIAFAGSNVSTIPPFAFIPDGYGNSDVGRVFDIDNAYVVQPINESSKAISKYYGFPDTFFLLPTYLGASPGLHLGKTWNATPPVGSTYYFKGSLGFPRTGSLTGNANASTFYCIGNLRLSWYMEFGLPINS